MDDLMPIGEFSDRSGLSLKRLRSYAADGLLVPAAVDPASGYRYYSPAQLREALVIDALRQADVSLAEIRVILRSPSKTLLGALERQVDEDAAERRQALDRARQLLAVSEPRGVEAIPEGAKMKELAAVGCSETGSVRDNNEDAIVASQRLAAVADGMGGHPGGEVAAQLATSMIGAAFTGRSLDELEAVVRAANWAIWERANRQPELAGMGTTVCAAGLLGDGRLGVVHVGDTRAYLLHDGEVQQLTQDHTLTADLIGRGELRSEHASAHPHFGILTRALGVAPAVTIDCISVSFGPGDRLLVCSDGLVNELSEVEIAGTLADSSDLNAVAHDLVNRALVRGGRDNVSVVLAEIAA